MKNRICYTGIGARKTGEHTIAQYLAVMDKTSGVDCPAYYESFRCKPCKTKKKMSKKLIQKFSKNPSYKISKKYNDRLNLIHKKCDTCKFKNTRKCTLKKYIRYSGALPGETCSTSKV